MQIGVLGVHFRSVPVSVREKISKGASSLLIPQVCLSTCNRVEIYFSGADLSKIKAQILFHFGGGPLFYFRSGKECFSHLCRVTSGLDSAIFLESEIQRQVKIAYQRSHEQFLLPGSLHYLFQKSLKVAKGIRTEFANGKKTVTLSHILCELSSLEKDESVLFIGNSEINRRILAQFSLRGKTNMALSTRSPEQATKLEGQYGCRILDWAERFLWNEYDLVIAATNHDTYVLNEWKEGRTKMIFDLGVPRNINPQLRNKLPLWNIDQIFEWKKQDQSDGTEIDQIIDKNAEKLIQIYHRKQAAYLSPAIA